MRALHVCIIIATCTLGEKVLAADMNGADIKTLLVGNTAYLETTAASASGQAGQSVIFWNADGTAINKTASGTIMPGTWEIKANTLCAVWKEKPMGCVRFDKAGDVVTLIDVASGQVRAKISRTAAGNVEKLTP
jgi:hypothetical protein